MDFRWATWARASWKSELKRGAERRYCTLSTNSNYIIYMYIHLYTIFWSHEILLSKRWCLHLASPGLHEFTMTGRTLLNFRPCWWNIYDKPRWSRDTHGALVKAVSQVFFYCHHQKILTFWSWNHLIKWNPQILALFLQGFGVPKRLAVAPDEFSLRCGTLRALLWRGRCGWSHVAAGAVWMISPGVNGHFRDLNWRYRDVLTIYFWPKFQG